MPDGQIRLKGAVEQGVVAEVMQFLSGRTDRVGHLRVTNSRMDGRIWYQGGTIVSAECGPDRDAAAIRRILCMKTGEFSFVDASNVPARTIYDDITTILLECFRQIDEAKDVEPDIPESPPDTINRPAAPWAGQGSNTLRPAGSALSTTTTPVSKPAAVSSTPRPSAAGHKYKPYTNQPHTNRRKKILTAAVLITLVISGLLFWWVAAEGTMRISFWRSLQPEHTQPPPPPPPAFVWPSIRLSGIVAVPGQTPSAVINGRFVLEGQTIEGVLLETVTRTGIVLRSGEQTLFLSEKTMGDPDESASHTNTVAAITNEPSSFASGFRSLMKRLFD